MYTEASILTHFDPGLHIEQDRYYPPRKPKDISYHFWLDLEHGYAETAGSRIHLYADDDRWAIVAEKSGHPDRNYITNVQRIILIDGDEWERITHNDGDEMEQFELISPDADYVLIRDKKVPIECDVHKYRELGIHSRIEDNPRNLISFVDLLRYYIEEESPFIIGNYHVSMDNTRSHLFLL